MKRIALVLLAIALLAAAPPWMTKFRVRALPYLDPRVQPRPKVSGGDVPSFRGELLRSYLCWGVHDGVVCSACYDNVARYYAQAEVICPWGNGLCRYLSTTDDIVKYAVDMNQCVVP